MSCGGASSPTSTDDPSSSSPGTLPSRSFGLLAAAAARPQASAFRDDAYPDLWTKAASLLHSIVKNHPLIDGNKRLGWLACAVFLDINDTDPNVASDDEVYDLVIHVAAHEIGIDELAQRLQGIIAANG